jgi:hypothetical protein
LKSVHLQFSDTFVSLDVVSLFNSVPVDEALKVIRNKLHNEDTLVKRIALQVEGIMELLEVCQRTTYFEVDNKFFQQKEGMAITRDCSAKRK